MLTLARIADLLAQRGHRVTATRRAVLAAVAGQADHFSVDDVLCLAPVGRATVFRTMKILVDMNIVCRVLLEDGTLHYRLSTGYHHHHVVCTACGRVEDFSDCGVSALVRELQSATQYAIDAHWLEVYGRCEACQAAEAGPGRAGAAARGIAAAAGAPARRAARGPRPGNEAGRG